MEYLEQKCFLCDSEAKVDTTTKTSTSPRRIIVECKESDVSYSFPFTQLGKVKNLSESDKINLKNYVKYNYDSKTGRRVKLDFR